MKISDVKTFLVHDAGRPGRNYTFVKIYTDEGLTGLGEAGVTWKELAVQGLVETYRPVLIGMDPSRIEHIWQTLWRGQFFRGGHVHSAAVAAIDLALWDLRGKVLGAPVYDLLGGRARDYVRCYCHVQGDAHGVPHGGIDEMVDYAKRQVARGWRYVRFGAGETRRAHQARCHGAGRRAALDCRSLRLAEGRPGPRSRSASTSISARRRPMPSSWPANWPR